MSRWFEFSYMGAKVYAVLMGEMLFALVRKGEHFGYIEGRKKDEMSGEGELKVLANSEEIHSLVQRGLGYILVSFLYGKEFKDLLPLN